MHKSQTFAIMMAAFLGGIILASVFFVSPQSLLGGFAVAVFLAIVAARQAIAGNKILFRQPLMVAALAVLVFTGGAYRFEAADARESVCDEFISRSVGGKGVSFTFRGYADGEFSKNGTHGSFPYRIKEIVAPQVVFRVDERVLVDTSASPVYRLGQKLVVTGALEAPENGDEFDYVTYLKKQGIRAIARNPRIEMYAGALPLGILERVRLAVFGPVFAAKSAFEKSVARSIPAPESAYINGILLGTRSAIPDSIREAFNRTGTSHVLAISGYNITLVAETVLGILLWRFRRRTAIWIAVAGIAAFTVMTGASASVVRAAVMGSVILVASGFGRLPDSRNAILLTAVVMTTFNPFLFVFDVGFQLSFGAVLGLIYVYPILQNRFNPTGESGGLREMVLMTLAAQAAVLPLLIGYFSMLSILSLPANILILPFMPAAMLLGFTTGLAGLALPVAGKVVGLAAWALSAYQLKVVELFSHLPGAAITVHLPWIIIGVLYAAGIWWVYRQTVSVYAK